MKIPDEFLVELKSKVDILEVAQEYFVLHKVGSIYQTNCPHGDKNSRSLTFFPETQSFSCFACGVGKKPKTEGSDVIAFIMWIENISFPEAVTKLATSKGIKIPTKDMSLEDKKKQKMLAEAIVLNRKYWTTLQDHANIIQYLNQRGITEPEINQWRIGYVSLTDTTKVSGRLVFSIMNEWGQTVGFSYRNMEDHFPNSNPDMGPKYMNSPKSLIFNKGSILYGLNFIKRMIREKNYIVLAEGFGDTILGQRYGCPFVSLMGTSLTEEHVKMLGRYTKNIYVWLDGDAGGVNAVLRHLDPLRKEGFMVKVIYTPGADPDDIVMNQQENLENFILESAVLAGQFEVNLIMNKFRSSITEHKLRTIYEIRSVLTSISNPMERMVYSNQIAYELSVDPILLMEGVENV